jgi:hypothetical protein
MNLRPFLPSLRALVVSAVSAAALPAAPGPWQTLFDGRDTSAWRTLGKPLDAPIGWKIEDGALAGNKAAGNLATKELYGDFELELEWRISAGGNSGILFRVDPQAPRPPFSGPEIQILDNARAKDGANLLTSAGALYALYAPAKQVAKPAGEWNALRLRVQGKRIQSWLNGVAVIDAEIGSADWQARVAKSKFAKSPEFAASPAGVIVLQDHGNPVWYRQIRIRRL